MVSRRTVQTVLGAVWFLDGLLQLKPEMFTSSFIKQVILPTGQGQPDWISTLVNWGAQVADSHIVVWNLLFALVQLALGIALMFNFKTKQTILASIVWSAMVWIFGEGVGQILTGQALLLTGAPGAVLIYALLGIAIWPAKNQPTRQWWVPGIRFAQISLGCLWFAGFLMHFQPSYLTPTGFSQAVSVPWLAKWIGDSSVAVSIVLGLVELALATMLLFKLRLRTAVWASVILSIVYWWVGQSFGQVLDPVATDVNSGPLMALLALCAYPQLWNAFQRRVHHKVQMH
ncbi:hypothetical protein LLE49_05945 [Alicyclobacillus tolerans]|uniref:hypothetical protein n=1 Tax=Alicyclobacillus tolerans TaxID=90970 RepID=UPI001F255BE5|nr:hypothetical protein [Alicyclobacillus tolerans]MCF8564284.1 hypothetical protein [Alicyclobacillus tolerans]